MYYTYSYGMIFHAMMSQVAQPLRTITKYITKRGGIFVEIFHGVPQLQDELGMFSWGKNFNVISILVLVVQSSAFIHEIDAKVKSEMKFVLPQVFWEVFHVNNLVETTRGVFHHHPVVSNAHTLNWIS